MDVLMPQLGETVAEGKITRWFKSVGEAVAPGDNLCEIETDKVTVEVPAISAGVLTAINAEVGTVAPVGTVIAVVSDSAEKARSGASRQRPPQGQRRRSRLPRRAALLQCRRRRSKSEARPRRGEHLDPFREVDTPPRNFGPATLANGIVVTPLARRLAAEAVHRPRRS